MRKLLGTRRRKIVALIALAVIAATVSVAFAYFSGSGKASKAGTTGSAPALTVTIGDIPPVYPDENGVDFPISVTNNSGHNSGVGAIQLDETQGDMGIGGLPAGCERGWFSFLPLEGQGAIADGATQTYTGTLYMDETGTPQDSCESADYTLYLEAVAVAS